jgi:hypothetical protein
VVVAALRKPEDTWPMDGFCTYMRLRNDLHARDHLIKIV